MRTLMRYGELLSRHGNQSDATPSLSYRCIGALILATAVLFLCAGCSSERSEPASTKIVPSPDANTVEMQNPQQFSLVEAGTRPIADELHVNGVVAPDVNRSVPVLSLSGGRVVEVPVRLGDDVKKGQVLLRISSPDVSSAFSDFEKFRADEALARRQLERAQLLYQRGAIAAKDLEVAQDAAEKAKADLNNATHRLRILGADANRPSPVLEVRAPISGTIVEQNVTGGTGVRSIDNSPNLFTIADLTHVWILCDVYENSLSRVNVGDIAEVTPNAYPERKFSGPVGNIGRVLDPNTRSAKVRIELHNPGRLLRSGMFVVATFRSQKPLPRVVLPTSAVVRLHDKDWVFVPSGGNRFRRLEVQLGKVLPDASQEVLSGLNPGDKVVSNALEFSRASESR